MRTHLAALAVLTLAPLARGADPVVMLETGKPVTLDWVEAEAKKNGRPLADCWGWVASEGFRPLQKPTTGSDPSGAPPLKFLQRVNVVYGGYSGYQSDGTRYNLVADGVVGSGKLRLLGWVPTARIVKDHRARADEASTILLKAMIVNSVQLVREKKVIDPAPILLAPEPGEGKEPFRFFNIYFVFGDTNPADDLSGYLLLGSRTGFNYNLAVNDDAEPGRAILGWVDKKRVCLWKTREALQWDDRSERTEPAKAYATEKEAKDAAKGKEVKTEVTESFHNGRPAAWEHNRMRYPIVPLSPDKPFLAVNDNNLRRIAVVGDLVDKEGRPVVSGAKIAALQQELATIQAQLNTTQIVFVIDDSDSMQEWFPDAAKVIGDLVAKVKADTEGGDFQIGITFYSDVPIDDQNDEAKLARAVERHGLVDARGQAAKTLIDDLARRRFRQGWDPREQVFRGLRTALDDPGWSPYARKMVILLGDMGDHDRNRTGDFAAEKGLAVRLAKEGSGESPIEFFALQVNNPRDADGVAFKTQAEKIAQLFRQMTADKRPAGFFPIADKDALRKVILDRFTELRRQAAGMSAEMEKVRRGEFNSKTQFEHPELSDIVGRLIKDKEIDLSKLAEGIQVFDYRYVWDKSPDGKQQTRRQLLLNGSELKTVHDLLNDFFAPGAEETPGIKQLATFIANRQAGQDGKEDVVVGGSCLVDGGGRPAPPEGRLPSAKTLLKVKHGFSFVSPLLEQTVDQLRPEAFADSQGLMQQLQKKTLLLDDLLAGKRYTYGKSPTNAGDRVNLARLKGEDKDRAFMIEVAPRKSAGGHLLKSPLLWYWVDFDEEWP